MMPKHRLRRTGKPPLVFEGEPLARVSNRWSGKELTNWQELSVYKTPNGFVAKVALLTTHMHGKPYESVQEFENGDEAIHWLRAFDPREQIDAFTCVRPVSDQAHRQIEEACINYWHLVAELRYRLTEGEVGYLPGGLT